MKIVALDQRTPEWHAWRSGIIGGSDAPVIMGVSPWTTIHKLWELKMGLREPSPDNPAMARGRMMESEALDAWMGFTGETAIPMCVQHETLGFVGASLDGATFDGALLLEIKCPGEKDHAAACETGQVPVKYWPQNQHQLACVPEAELLHYWSYRPRYHEPKKLIEVRRDQAYIDDMLEKEDRFWEAVKAGRPPAGDAWQAAERIYLDQLEESEEADALLKQAKEDLLATIPKGVKKQDGAWISASLVAKSGATDYKGALSWLVDELCRLKDPQTEVQDLLTKIQSSTGLDPFKKKGSEYWDVRRKKGV
jgi:putative phage-type endonuclease